MNEPEFEYLKVEVTRTESTDLYLKVPKGWRPWSRHHAILGKAARATTDSSDWDSYMWEQTVEAQCCHPCPAEEAEQYRVFDVLEELAKQNPPATTAPSPQSCHPPADTGAPLPAPAAPAVEPAGHGQ